MATLVDLATQQRYDLDARVVIGRAATCNVRIDDPLVGLEHAAIERQDDGSFLLRDLGSKRGTHVGTHRIVEVTLHDRDELLVGPARMRFEVGATAGEPTARELDELRCLRAIAELSRAVGVEHDLDKLLERVLATCFQLLDADRGMIIIYPPNSKTPCATVARLRTGEPTDAMSTTVLSQLLATREPYMRTEIDHDLSLQRSASLSSQGVRSVMAVPLRYGTGDNEWLGVIHVDSVVANNVFVRRDLEVLAAIADHAALAIKNALLVRQLHDARTAEWLRLERIVRELPVGIVVVDDARRCVLVNEWARSRADVVGAFAPGAAVEAVVGVACDRVIADGRSQVSVGERTFTLGAFASADQLETVVVIHEITEEWTRLAKVAHQERLALVGQLAGGIAHDFNNLLCVILNYAMMLEETLEKEQRDDAGAITNAARSAADLVRQLLAFSRREVVKPQVVEVGKLVRQIEPVLRRAVGGSVELVLDIAEDIPDILIAPSQLEQIVLNLVINARDAMPDGGRVLVRACGSGDHAQLHVEDTGTGMAPDVVARIFEPYFTTKPRGKGTGLGLATVQGIVQHAQGDITVASELGRGTAFTVVLPKTDQPRPPVPGTKPKRATLGRIMLVDDDPGIRRMTGKILERAGYRVIVASNGPEALALLKDNEIDLLLTDMVMPGMSGRDLARRVMRDKPQVKLLFMSGYHPGAPIRGARFLEKPFDHRVMLDRISDALQDDLVVALA